MTEKHSPLKSVAAIKITFTDGRPDKIIRYGSKAECMQGMCLAWREGVSNVEEVAV